MSISFNCPDCGVRIKAADQHAGKKARCPNAQCGKTMTVPLPMPSEEWYYKVMGEQHGPVSFAQLKELAKSGQISQDTSVKKGPEGKWLFAFRVPGLFALEVLGSSGVSAPTGTSASDRPAGGGHRRRAVKWAIYAAIGVIVVGVGFVIRDEIILPKPRPHVVLAQRAREAEVFFGGHYVNTVYSKDPSYVLLVVKVGGVPGDRFDAYTKGARLDTKDQTFKVFMKMSLGTSETTRRQPFLLLFAVPHEATDFTLSFPDHEPIDFSAEGNVQSWVSTRSFE